MLDVVDIINALLGTIFSVIVVTTWLRLWGFEIMIGRKYMRLQRDEPMTIVLPSSDHKKGGAEYYRYQRQTINRPSVDTLATLTNPISSLRYNKTPRLTLSECSTELIKDDLLLVGGPFKNDISRRFVEKFNETHHALRIDRDLVEYDKKISPFSSETEKVFEWHFRIGGNLVATLPGIKENDADKEEGGARKEGKPVESDVAILLVWKNPFAEIARPRRAIMFAGLTGMGNNAAAQYLAQSRPTGYFSFRTWRRQNRLPWLFSRKWPMFLVVLDVRVKDQNVLSFEELLFKRIPDCDE